MEKQAKKGDSVSRMDLPNPPCTDFESRASTNSTTPAPRLCEGFEADLHSLSNVYSCPYPMRTLAYGETHPLSRGHAKTFVFRASLPAIYRGAWQSAGPKFT